MVKTGREGNCFHGLNNSQTQYLSIRTYAPFRVIAKPVRTLAVAIRLSSPDLVKTNATHGKRVTQTLLVRAARIMDLQGYMRTMYTISGRFLSKPAGYVL